MSKLVSSAVALFLLVPGLATAQEGVVTPDEIIAARQGGMALVGGVIEAMKAGVQSGAEVKPFTAGAEALAKWGRAYRALYPDGTQTGHETKAKPEIWSDRAGFEKADATMIVAAEKLAEAAKSGDKDTFSVAFKTTTEACAACHKAYKAR